MAKSTVTEIPTAEAPKAGKQPPKQGSMWPAGVPIVGDPEAQTFPEWLASTTEEDWDKRLICYLWRCEPITDRKSGGGPSSIDILTRKFDSKEILKLHGSGRYRFDISYRPPDGGKQKRVRQDYETIFNLDHPPKIAVGEWLEDPRNKDWAWCRPQLEAEEKQRVLKAAAALNGNEPAPASQTAQLTETIELVQKLVPKDSNQALLIELLRQANPTNMLTLAKELAALNQPGQATNGEGSMQMMLMKYLLDEMKEARQSRSNPADPMEVATSFLTKAKDLFGGSGLLAPAAGGAVTKLDATSVAVQGATDILGKVVDGVSSHLPDLIRVFQYSKQVELEIAKIAAAKDMNPAKPWEYAGPTAAPVMNPNPAPRPASASAPMPTPPPPQTYTPEPQAMSPQLFFAKYQRVLQNHFQFLVDNFQHEDGYAFRDHLIAREGQNTVASIRGDATVDLLMQLCQSHPQLREIFQPPEKAKLFFTELLTDPDAPGEDPAAGDDEPAIPEVVS
jgi:hypothetical protein